MALEISQKSWAGGRCRSVPAQLDTDGSSDEERGARLGGSAREPFLEVPVEEEEKYGNTSKTCSRS